MSDLLIELSCMQDWPEHYFGAVFDCEENLKSILSICKHHMPRWETDEVFFDKSDDTEYGKVRTNSMENNIQHINHIFYVGNSVIKDKI